MDFEKSNDGEDRGSREMFRDERDLARVPINYGPLREEAELE